MSAFLSISLDTFLELDHWFFLNFGVMLETCMKFKLVRMDQNELFLCPQLLLRKALIFFLCIFV